jgi:CDP-diacylglycerol--serine O-phosphatidyltransferase
LLLTKESDESVVILVFSGSFGLYKGYIYMKKHIPNIITLSNLVCGTLAVWQALQGNLICAALFIFLGAFFDFFDGMTARLLHVQSAIGKELDSLSDVVTFGVAPGFIVFSLLETTTSQLSNMEWMKFVALLMPALSSYRLAKFNLDERQTSSFIGLPTPANAMVWAAYGIILSVSDPSRLLLFSWFDGRALVELMSNPWFIGVLSVAMSISLVLEVPLFALKFKNFYWADNKVRYLFLGIDLLLLLFLGVYAVLVIIFFYVLLSIVVMPRK